VYFVSCVITAEVTIDAAAVSTSVVRVPASSCHHHSTEQHSDTLSTNTSAADVCGTVNKWRRHLSSPLQTRQDDFVAQSTSGPVDW